MTSLVGIEYTLDQLVERALTRAASGKRYILGITGAPGSGKSTVAEALVDRIGPELAVLVSMDGFHLANKVLIDLDRSGRKGAFDTYDVPGYTALLDAIQHQSSLEPVDGRTPVIYGPEFRRGIEESVGSAVAVRPDVPLVVTEGNYLLLDKGGWPAATRHLDEVWFLAPDTDVRMSRLISRHRQFGRSPQEAVDWANGPDQVNAEMIEATAADADLVVHLVEETERRQAL